MVIVPMTYLGEVSFKNDKGESISCSQFIFFNSLDIFYTKSISNLKKGKEYKVVCEVSGKKLKIKEVSE